MARIPQEEGLLEVYFCPNDPCEQELFERINQSMATIHCAFYNLNLESIMKGLERKSNEGVDVQIIIENDNRKATEKLAFVKYDDRSAYMHNKFCIFDGKEISTGSMKPTTTDVAENKNNLLFITSLSLAKNYEEEFHSMWNGNFGREDNVKFQKILFNNVTIENYFCPEDNCEDHIVEILKEASISIRFMEFSFTSDVLGDILVEKAKEISVVGIFEKSQKSVFSEYEKLLNASINATIDSSSGLLHHKVFIIDNAVVITGSMNPSKNGNENNDENILIIHSKEIAALYIQEFERVMQN